jgi:hypothetical protein
VPFQGVALNFLRPQPTTATALLSLALILALAAVVLAAAHVLNTRTSESEMVPDDPQTTDGPQMGSTAPAENG